MKMNEIPQEFPEIPEDFQGFKFLRFLRFLKMVTYELQTLPCAKTEKRYQNDLQTVENDRNLCSDQRRTSSWK